VNAWSTVKLDGRSAENGSDEPSVCRIAPVTDESEILTTVLGSTFPASTAAWNSLYGMLLLVTELNWL